MKRSGIQGNPIVMATPVVWGHDHLGCGCSPALDCILLFFRYFAENSKITKKSLNQQVVM